MAKKFGFFNSINGDRKYLASDIASAFEIGITTGLKADTEDNFQIVPQENMTVKMLPGGAMVFGHYILDDEEELITLDIASGELNRIDRVVLRYDKYERSVKTLVIKGTPALNPTAPAPLKTEEQFDLVLADIRVNKATTSIVQSNITDMRESELCGFIGVKGAVSQTDFDRHLARDSSQAIMLTRDISLAGLQTVECEVGRVPKTVAILASSGPRDTRTFSISNGGGCIWRGEQFVYIGKENCILGSDPITRTLGTVVNNRAGAFDIKWIKQGQISGSAELQILVTYHD